ncbi:MAG: HEPN domain-containing protein [Candidatus Hydrogenedentes bacterium]|nr:HEPN domain-containing protein [Candidatus Hydrogenedentota bacterium]
MNPLTFEWIEKAEGDYAVASREMRARRNPNYDAVCFHSQQCAEKYLKAILHWRRIRFEKTHNLIVLLDQVLPVAPLLEPFRDSMSDLTEFAVMFRYPGDSATKDMARDALKKCRAIRSVARSELGLPESQ